MKLLIPAGMATVLLLSACSAKEDSTPQSAETTDEIVIEDADYAERFGQGETIAEAACSGCHAIGKTGESPHAEAPAFRTFSTQYPIESLAEPLAEGIMVGHPDMPEFQFEALQIDALLTYIESVQPPQE